MKTLYKKDFENLDDLIIYANKYTQQVITIVQKLNVWILFYH